MRMSVQSSLSQHEFKIDPIYLTQFTIIHVSGLTVHNSSPAHYRKLISKYLRLFLDDVTNITLQPLPSNHLAPF